MPIALSLGMIHVTLCSESVDELLHDAGRRAFAAGAAARVEATARALLAQGQGWGSRKVALARLADAMAMPLARLAPLLVLWQAAGLVQLCRADLVPDGMVALLQRSAVGSLNSEFHYLVVE